MQESAHNGGILWEQGNADTLVINLRHMGSMDTDLWRQVFRDLYIPLYEGHISPEPIQDPVTMKLIAGPLIVKTDSGPGRLSKEADSIQVCEQMAGLGMHIFLLLPNATACTAKIDQLFEKLRLACSKSAFCVASRKMQQRMMVRVENANQVVSLLDGLDMTTAKLIPSLTMAWVNIVNKAFAM